MNDLCWLLNRGYASHSAVELVGNRHRLTRRQRVAVARCACTDKAAQRRQQHETGTDRVRGSSLWLDGYNVLTILESALAGAVILLGRDGCCRDVAGVHRRHHQVQETLPALHLVGETTSRWGATGCRWWLDKPVSNSGRLKALLLEVATSAGWKWEVELVPNPDRILSATDELVATSDSVILDRCQRWINLTRLVVAERVIEARVVDLAR